MNRKMIYGYQIQNGGIVVLPVEADVAGGTFVTVCEPLRQGRGLHIREKLNMTSQCGGQLGSKKRSLPATLEKLLELPIDWRGYPKRNLKQIWQSNRQPVNASPPNRWWHDFGIPKQSIAFA